MTNILYDQYGQRTRIDYGNGTFTEYNYDPARRWLDTIKTQNKWGQAYQNISYSFDAVGNVLGYENDCLDSVTGNYKTKQTYSYDNLYQLIKADGETTYNPYRSSVPEFKSNYSQSFVFDDIGLGNMTSKVSSESITPQKTIGDNLNYSFAYNYDENYAHRLINAGDRYYKYDANGNIICEQDGAFDSNEPVSYHKINRESDDVYSTDYGWGLFKEDDKGGSGKANRTKYKRTYKWNERNQLISSVDSNYNMAYIYGQDGQRSNKYTQNSETLYFNKMWTLHTDSGNNVYGGQSAKNIYLGETRIVTKLNSGTNPTYQEEYYKQYFYHSDHLGSASLISDYKGDEYQRIEYTPYGETWVEKTSNTGLEWLPYKFTAKELDEETGLYYYGARYLDPKYSMWISTDPALGEYIPKAPVNEEAKRYNQNLPGMGGVFNHINGNLYHYAANNPVCYIDPDGRIAGLIFYIAQSYSYDFKNHVIYTTRHSFQQGFGYFDIYDDVARKVFGIDCLDLQFQSGKSEYHIRAWKGHYWGAIGGEFGIYGGGFGPLGGGSAWREEIKIQFSIQDKDGNTLLNSPSKKQYWLFANKPFKGMTKYERGSYIITGHINFGKNSELANDFDKAYGNNNIEGLEITRKENTNQFIIKWSEGDIDVNK